jgi:hypothetical protein
MIRKSPLLLLFALAACGGQSNEEALQDAANQSDPAAAAVLNGAAENGVDPQNALAAAGQAQVQNGSAAPSGSLQAKPNLPNDPNRPEGGQPPAKVSTDQNAGQNRQ